MMFRGYFLKPQRIYDEDHIWRYIVQTQASNDSIPTQIVDVEALPKTSISHCLAILKYRLIYTVSKEAFTTAKTTLCAILIARSATDELSNGPWFSSNYKPFCLTLVNDIIYFKYVNKW